MAVARRSKLAEEDERILALTRQVGEPVPAHRRLQA
jgi:hypothetical protein